MSNVGFKRNPFPVGYSAGNVRILAIVKLTEPVRYSRYRVAYLCCEGREVEMGHSNIYYMSHDKPGRPPRLCPSCRAKLSIISRRAQAEARGERLSCRPPRDLASLPYGALPVASLWPVPPSVRPRAALGGWA